MFNILSLYLHTQIPTLVYEITRQPLIKPKPTLTCEDAIAKLPGSSNCFDLKTTENFTVTILRGISYAKQTTSNGFTWRDVQYIADENCELPDNCTTDQSILSYDVFYPAEYPYSTCTTYPPCVILFKASGFSDCNNADAVNLEIVAILLARRGFIVFAPRYRTGRILSNKTVYYQPYNKNVAFTTGQQVLSFYCAFQDCRGAIRSIFKRNSETTTQYKFDENNIFIGGFSTGSICAFNAAYYPTPDMMNQVDGGAHTVLGGIDEDFYYGEPTIEYHSKIKAVLNCWGSGFIPEAFTDNPGGFFPANDKIPLISFHGKADPVLPYNNLPVFYPPTTGINSFSDNDILHQNIKVNPVPLCPPSDNTSFVLDFGQTNTPDSWRFGSKKMFCYLRSINVYTEFYLDDLMMHGVRNGTDNFGAPYYTVPDIYGYIAVRAATFFQAILIGQINAAFINALKNASNNKLFEECENTRVACATSNPTCTTEPPDFCTGNN